MRKERKGSALLIVLGMLSFMVVSAVSFAIYMRQSRAPSSYLRRNSSARYLLKAALANAIARIDGSFATEAQIDNDNIGSSTEQGYCEGIFDDPYPGVGPKQYTLDAKYFEQMVDPDSSSKPSNTRSNQGVDGDLWIKRVFCPFGMVTPDETVSTLTLEGLAYLPPAIINEARLVSRYTRTAKWRNLSYDAGRYAFTAIDVSDCFDINKLLANERRTSAPNQRVNLSSLFPNNGSALDSLLTKWDSSNIPFVSLADFNIMAQSSDFTPFVDYITSKGASIYDTGDAQAVSNALFITDTWFPPTNTTASVTRFDLAAGGENQPFRSFSTSATFLEIAKNVTSLNRVLQKNIGGVGLACLYDYLDKNNRPISFVIPTVETAPMVCGIGLAHNSQFTPKAGAGNDVTSKDIPDPTVANVTYIYISTPYNLTALCGNMMLSGLVAFPFKRTSAESNRKTSFTGEALIRIFMGPKTLGTCRLADSSPLYPSSSSDWNDGYKDGIVTINLKNINLSFESSITATRDAIKQFTAEIQSQAINAPLFYYVREIKKVTKHGTVTQSATGNNYYSLDGVGNNASALVPRDKNGEIASWWKTAAASAGTVIPQAGGGKPNSAGTTLSSEEYVPHVLVWVRIKDGNETVDIVPARIDDDKIWGPGSWDAQGEGAMFGEGTPVLEFCGDESRAFTYDTGITGKLSGAPDTFPKWTQLYAVDPRYNFAPENWAAETGNGDANVDDWLKLVGADATGGLLGSDGRDRDIFMFTSDQEYMQSAGELMFLPATEEMDGSSDYFQGYYSKNTRFNGNDFTYRIFSKSAALSQNDMSKFGSGDFFWRTYTAYNNGFGYDPVYELKDGSIPVEIVSGSGDFRVNPFSPDTRVLMAALKDTPFDYYVASTNESQNETADDKPSGRNRFAFCSQSSVAKLDDDELEDIAGAFCDKFDDWARNQSKVGDRFNWQAAFRDMGWCDTSKANDDQKTLFDVDNLNECLHGVDRKFLYSFWRECFQNRQQLFLIFIRAEPLTVGGMGEGSLASSQLGARGVALVWRDPQPPTRGGIDSRPVRTNMTKPTDWSNYYDTFAPHRTRVLFYHQFD